MPVLVKRPPGKHILGMLNPGQRILLVEDDRGIADTLVYALRSEGFVPHWVTSGGEALQVLETEIVDLALLDLGLPDVSGFELLRTVVEQRCVPVVVITARGETIDRVTGLEMGADDYITKPFSPREVTARIRAVLRRTNGQDDPIRAEAPPASEWTHDAAGCTISFRGSRLDLTRYEYRLLAHFLAHPGRVFSRDQLMERIWEDPGASTDRTVDAHIKTIRAKLRAIDPSMDLLRTHRGLGYSFVPAPA